jgi:hypothetical protein
MSESGDKVAVKMSDKNIAETERKVIRIHESGDVQLRFGKANAKLAELERGASIKYIVATFSLPAGWTCPFAVDCLTKADRITGKVTDGKQMEFRCFAASDEARSPDARKLRWHNFDSLRQLDSASMAKLIDRSLHIDKHARKANVIRIHVSGDFFNQAYFDAWCAVANMNPDTVFYAYTKSINYWVANLGAIPNNLNLTASWGGRHDALIGEYNLKSARVVFSEDEALQLGLTIDHDDSHAAFGNASFALLVHGTQPKGSKASAALSTMRANGTKFSYSSRS